MSRPPHLFELDLGLDAVEPPAAPAWLLGGRPRAAGNGRAEPLPPTIKDGSWHTVMVSAAGTLLAHGFTEQAAVAALLEQNATYDGALADDGTEIRELVADVYGRYPAGRELELLRGSGRRFEFAPLVDFLAHPFPQAEPLLGEPGAIFLARGSLLMVYGSDGSGKSTWTVDGVAHLAAGVDWLGVPVPRPVRVCVIENEGPPSLFQQKLEAKRASWEDADFADNVFVFEGPWGEFSFADADARAALVEFCEEREVDLVAANPTLGLGVAAAGRPDETQQFVDWLVECGLKSSRAFWLLHHENKSGQISGDWGRHPDTKVQLTQDGNHPRTKLDWSKTRWATLPSDTIPKVCMLEWVVETQGYSVTELDTVGASDAELEQRLVDYLTEHPLSATTTVETEVKGTASRIRRLLEGQRFDSVKGKRGANLWLLSPTPSPSAENEPTG